MTGRIILLNGASSSGKSTLARALQDALPTPFRHLGFDTFRDHGALPMHRFGPGGFNWRNHRAQVFDGVHRAVEPVARAGNDVIFETILDTPGWLRSLRTRLQGIDVLFVGVSCPPDVLERRETRRDDRQTGSALRDHDLVHRGMVYDLTVDGTAPFEINARLVRDALAAPRTGFFRPRR